MWKKRRLVILAVAAALALTACTAAAVRYQDWFSFVSSPGSEAVTQKLFSDMGMVIGDTVTDAETGVSVTLDGCLYDGVRMALALTVTGMDLEDQGQMFASGDAEEIWLISETALERTAALLQEADGSAEKDTEHSVLETMKRFGGRPGDAEEIWLISETALERTAALLQEADGSAEKDTEHSVLETMKRFGGRPQGLYIVKTEEDAGEVHLEVVSDLSDLGCVRSGDTMQFYLKNVSYRDDVVLAGEFLFCFALPERDLARRFGAMTAETAEGTMKIEELTILPSGVYADCDGPVTDDAARSAVQFSQVRLRDGSTYGFQSRRSSVTDGRVTALSGVYAQWQFISPGEVEAVCIGEDTWITLE